MVCDHGDESILCELENSWDALQTQTSWVLELCTKPASDNTSNKGASNAANTAPNSHSAQEDSVLESNNGSTDQEQPAGKDKDNSQTNHPQSSQI